MYHLCQVSRDSVTGFAHAAPVGTGRKGSWTVQRQLLEAGQNVLQKHFLGPLAYGLLGFRPHEGLRAVAG